jgi:hypothetical protein
MARHRKPDEFGDPNEQTEQHPIIDVEEVDLDDLGRQPAREVPRHERFEPMYQGGIDPHKTSPITRVEAGGSGEQIPWPLVPPDEPLAAEREPKPALSAAAVRRQHGLLVWSVTATIAAFGATFALLYTLLVMRPEEPARCTHNLLTPTVTITAPAPQDSG